jgi:GT2 family glycosyltransferase
MPEQSPLISVIIPTHNRCASLLRLLDALSRQDYPLERIEVVVVADHCQDDTIEALSRYLAPFVFKWAQSPVRGPSSARNLGASLANGTVLIFLDDDTVPAAGFVCAHQRIHERQSGVVGIGYCPPVIDAPRSFFNDQLGAWWNAMFDCMRAHGYRFGYTDLLSGNFSIPAHAFKKVGGFDATFFCHEDYELGLRLIKVGYCFIFAADALAYHHEKTDLRRSLERKCQEGKADVRIAQLHPEVLKTLPLARPGKSIKPIDRLLQRIAFQGWRRLLPACSWYLLRRLDAHEERNRKNRWRKLLDHLLFFYYWQGVAEQLGEKATLCDFLAQLPEPKAALDAPLPIIDLKDGLRAAAGKLDQMMVPAVTVCYGSHRVGVIKPVAGRQCLKGVHLRAHLFKHLSENLLDAVFKQSFIDRSDNG